MATAGRATEGGDVRRHGTDRRPHEPLQVEGRCRGIEVGRGHERPPSGHHGRRGGALAECEASIARSDGGRREHRPYNNNFSNEETRISEAPAARRRSMDSQKTSSSMAVWTATQPGSASGTIVGAFSPGTTLRISGRADTGAFIIRYL